MDQICGLENQGAAISSSSHSLPLIVLLGPTASGKTALAVALAKQINGAIISADSRQVFRGMDIGTGKDLETYEDVPYYLIDIRDAGDDYHVAHFQDDFQEAFMHIKAQNQVPILCGGTGFYIQSVLQDYTYTAVPLNLLLREKLKLKDKEELEKYFLSLPKPVDFKGDTSTQKRLIRAIEVLKWLENHDVPKLKRQQLNVVLFGLDLPVEERRRRITLRLQERLDKGLLNEVQNLLNNGISPDKLKFYGLEYKYATAYLLGEIEEQEFFTKLNTEIHRYAKRQMTYFRKMEKDGLHIHWIDALKHVDKNKLEMLQILKANDFL